METFFSTIIALISMIDRFNTAIRVICFPYSAKLNFYVDLESGLEFRPKGTSTNYVMCFLFLPPPPRTIPNYELG